jgi:putative transcriptional regulator
MKPLWGFALLCTALSAGHAQELPKTFFLVARPGMPDPNFRETVVLATENERSQVVGVIINRPTTRSLAELLPGDRFKRFTDPLYFGGPVEPGGVFAVFRGERPSGETISMLAGVHLALHPDTVYSLIGSPPADIRFFAGYSGWASGQLEAEIERGDWLIAQADAEAIFRRDTSALWQDMLRRASAVRASAGTGGQAKRALSFSRGVSRYRKEIAATRIVAAYREK